jgi:hypothetical protein
MHHYILFLKHQLNLYQKDQFSTKLLYISYTQGVFLKKQSVLVVKLFSIEYRQNTRCRFLLEVIKESSLI